jgi:hypothetical protein
MKTTAMKLLTKDLKVSLGFFFSTSAAGAEGRTERGP